MQIKYNCDKQNSIDVIDIDIEGEKIADNNNNLNKIFNFFMS